MRYFEQLLGRPVTSAELDEAVRRGFKAMTAALEKRRFAATDRPRGEGRSTECGRAPRRTATRGRYIPAAIRRQVWQRDEGRCTFVTESGRRCEARGAVEFDHVEPLARGGPSTVENLRVRCRAHNPYEAERMFGAGFMHEKRERARAAAARDRHGRVTASDVADELIPCLRQLGFRADEARRAAEHCAGLRDATPEQRVRSALSFLAPRARVERPPAMAASLW
jgi:5-methylcytosine-specific restriction endonuclease McrA